MQKNRFLPALLLLLPLLPVKAQDTADSVYLFKFLPERNMFYAACGRNTSELERLLRFVERHKANIMEGILPIRVDGYCLSLPTEKENRQTAALRSNRVKSELIIKAGLKEACFLTRNHTTLSDGRKDAVIISLRVPQADVPDSICPTGYNETVVNTQAEKILPTVQHSDSVGSGSNIVGDTPPGSSVVSGLSLRANLLRWATLTPDLGVEWRINRNWGILINASWTSWSWDNKNRRYALWKVSPEIRYYMGKEQRGYLGAMYHIGEFNYKLGETGRQGDYQGGGVTGGYTLPLNRTLALDFNIGAGYTRADYDKYIVTDGIRVWQGSDSKNYWGIRQVGITLAWKFLNRIKN